MDKLSLVFIATILTGASVCRAEAVHGHEPYDWSGFYLGTSLGLHDVTTSGVFDGPELGVTPDLENIGGEGVNFVFQGGYNYQVNRFVLGVESDVSLGGFDKSFVTIQDGSVSEAGLLAYPIEGELKYLATLRGRTGFIMEDIFPHPTLLFATGGLAFTDFNLGIANGRSEFGFSKTGLTWGFGIEMPFSDQILLRADFLHTDFDERRNIAGVATSGIFDANDGNFVKLKDVDIIRVGLDFKLGKK